MGNIERIARVSNQMCSAHAALRDRYADRALFLDMLILTLTLWLTAMAFVDPAIAVHLTPASLGKDLWLGLLAVFTFLLSIVQIRVDWKGLADGHERAVRTFSGVAHESRQLLAKADATSQERDSLLAKYEFAGAQTILIPESKFIELKRQHLLKIELSRLLDTHPGASPRLLFIKVWWRDNFKRK